MKAVIIVLGLIFGSSAYAVITEVECERSGGYAYSPRSEMPSRFCVDGGPLNGFAVSTTEFCPATGVTAEECEDHGGYAFTSHGESSVRFCVEGSLNSCPVARPAWNEN